MNKITQIQEAVQQTGTLSSDQLDSLVAMTEIPANQIEKARQLSWEIRRLENGTEPLEMPLADVEKEQKLLQLKNDLKSHMNTMFDTYNQKSKRTSQKSLQPAPQEQLKREQLYQSYVDSGLYDKKQLTQLRAGLAQEIDVSVYANPALSATEMKEYRLQIIQEKRETQHKQNGEKLDAIDTLTPITEESPKYTKEQMNQIKESFNYHQENTFSDEKFDSVKPKKVKAPTTKELLAELQASNAEMAEAMREMQAEIQKLREENSRSFLQKLFHKTTESVKEAADTCDKTIHSLQKEKEILRQKKDKDLGAVHKDKKDSLLNEMIVAVEELYATCEQKIDDTIEAINEIKKNLKNTVIGTKDKIKTFFASKGEKATEYVARELNYLKGFADNKKANALEKKADSYRSNSNRTSQTRRSILQADRNFYELKLRLKNATHALKGESMEKPDYHPQGIIKKIGQHLTEKISKENEQAKEAQTKADILRHRYEPETQEETEEQEQRQGMSM